MTTFRFDFAPALERGSEAVTDFTEPTSSTKKQGKVWSVNDANALIARLVHRSETSGDECLLWNASSKILPLNDNLRDKHTNGNCDSSGENANEKFEPLLYFHSHESISFASSMHCNMEKLRHVIPKHTLSDTSTDLIPGVYEGLKVWECSIDLCRFLANVISELPRMMTMNDDATFTASSSLVEEDLLFFVRAAVKRCIDSGGVTLELGCGHGLPGCLILRENIRRSVERAPTPTRQHVVSSADDVDDNSMVIFSDFNDFVLHRATIPNAQLNICGIRQNDGVAMDECRIAQALLDRSMFVGGDWMGLSQRLSNGLLPLPGRARLKKPDVDANRLDLILASETTYTPESCEDTAFFMLRHLKVEVGVGLVATKRFYFGVGGGTDLFTAACETLSMSDSGQYSDLRLIVRTVQSYDSGNANIRDLLEVRCIIYQKPNVPGM